MSKEDLYKFGKKVGGKELMDSTIVHFCIEDVLSTAVYEGLVESREEVEQLLSEECLHTVRKCFEAGIMSDWTWIMEVAIGEGMRGVK